MSASAGNWVIDVADADFDTRVLEKSQELPVVVDFWAEWCGPCRLLGPLLEKAAARAQGKFLLAKVDVDRSPNLAMDFRVQSIPTVLAFRNGQIVGQFSGAINERELEAFLAKLQPREDESLVGQAAAIEATDPERAESLYRRALEEDDKLDSARLGLARVLATRGNDAEAAALLDKLAPGGELSAEIERVRAILELRALAGEAGDVDAARRRVESATPRDARALLDLGRALAVHGRHEEALAALLEAAELDRELGRGPVRELMVKVFRVIGIRSPLADEYRSRLSRTLY